MPAYPLFINVTAIERVSVGRHSLLSKQYELPLHPSSNNVVLFQQCVHCRSTTPDAILTMPTLGLCIDDWNATHSKDADGNVDPSMSTYAAKSMVNPSSNAVQSAGGSASAYRSLPPQYYQALQESTAMAHADNTTPQADNTMGRGAYSSMVEGVNLQAQFAVPPETFNPLSLMPNPTFAPPPNGGE